MANANKNYLNIPFKQHLRQLRVDKEGKLNQRDIDSVANMEFENYKAIERRVNQAIAASIPIIDLGEGAVYTGWSKGYYFNSSESMSRVVATMEAPGTSDTEINVARNGAPFGELTIPAGETSSSWSGVEGFAVGDRWQIQVVTGGTGALGLTVYGVLV